MFCPKCKSEYRAGFTRCSECGVVLLFRLPSEPQSDDEDEMELVVVRTYNNVFDIDLAKSALEAAGIESLVRGDDYGRRGPHFSFVRGIDLLVRSEDAADADKILSLDVGG